MEMPKPTQAHRKMERLIGLWKGKERIFPSPFDPIGGEAQVTIENRIAFEGLVMIQEYMQERNGKISFQGHGVLRWDGEEGSYVFHWFDSMGLAPNEFRGTLEGDVLSLESKDELFQSRIVYELLGTDRCKGRMEFSQNGKDWKPFFEGEYSRMKK